MLTHDDLKRLAAISGPCLTVLQPLRETHLRIGKPNIRIEAAIRESRRRLSANGFSAGECSEMLRPLEKIASNTDWRRHRGSVVLFGAPDFTMVNFWPEELEARVHFAQEFLIVPLLGLWNRRDFWLLALSINSVKLFRGSGRGLVEVDLPADVPKSLSESEGFAPFDHSRSGVWPPTGTVSAREIRPNYLHDFFRMIDCGIQATLAHDRQPLILAAVSGELAIYRRVNSYTPVLTGAIHGSPEAMGVNALFAKAMDLMAAHAVMTGEAMLREVEEARVHGLAVTDAAGVIEASRMGLVEKLILAPEAPGFRNREALINWAVLAAVRNCGTFGIVNGPQPAEGVAAILRYPVEGETAGQSLYVSSSGVAARE